MRLRIVAALAMLAVGIGAVGFVFFRPGASTSSSQLLTGVSTTTDVVEAVVASGALSASATYGLAFGADPQVVSSASSAAGSGAGSGSWLVKTVNVAVGDEVTRGQALASADTADASLALALAEANLATAQARLALDLAGPSAADKASAYGQIKQAQQSLAQAKSGEAITRSQNDLKLSQAETTLQTAQAKLAADIAAGTPGSVVTADESSITGLQQQVDTLNLQIGGASTSAALAAQQNALRLGQLHSALVTAQNRLAADQAAQPPVQSTIDADQAAVDAAQLAYDQQSLANQIASTNASQSMAESNLRLSQLQASLATAKGKLATDLAAGAGTSVLESDQAAVTQAQAQLDTLELSLAASTQSTSNQLASAELALQSARDAYATKTQPAATSTIESDRAAVLSAEANVANAQKTLDRATITAPADGVVSVVSVLPSIVAPSGNAIEIQVQPLQVVASVAESDRPQLKVGQEATVAITALGETIAGRVSAISPTVSGGQSSVVSYPVTVILDGAPADAAVGMTAEISITIAQALGVVAVSTAAVTTSASGASTVRVLTESGGTETREVEIGLVSRTYTEIKSGLAAGETVVIGTSSSRTGTTTDGGALPGGGGFIGGGGFRP